LAIAPLPLPVVLRRWQFVLKVFFESSETTLHKPGHPELRTMLAILLKPTWDGWAVCLTDGSQLARFHGPGAYRRAQRYLARCLHRA
jgi:hypothetical protein